MYYIGTYEECLAYLKQVNEGENYEDTTLTYADIIETMDGCAIIKHINYTCEMKIIEVLNLPDARL